VLGRRLLVLGLLDYECALPLSWQSRRGLQLRVLRENAILYQGVVELIVGATWVRLLVG
jgi:hypothetical protein